MGRCQTRRAYPSNRAADMTGILRSLSRAVSMMLARAAIVMTDDGAPLQRLQLDLLSGEVKNGVERFQEYGFTSHPHPGAGALVVFLGGNRDRGIVVAVDDRRYRLKGLAEGEVALYDEQGQKIVLYRDRIEVEAVKVVVKSDDVHLGAEGGARVARIGDKVLVGSGSSAGLHPIVEGSDKVRCAGGPTA